ncbi:hypothetical protein [Helicobacter sp. T3_23-1056]
MRANALAFAWQSTTKNIGGNPHYDIDKIDCHDSATFDKVAESHNDGIVSHSLAEGARGWVSCHTKQSEVSQNVDKNRDISGFALNMTKNSNQTKIYRHCETSAGSRGNPQCNTESIDCHASLATCSQ